MKTRHLIPAAIILSAFSLQAFRLSAQQVAQPQISGTAEPKPLVVPVVTATTTAASGTAPEDVVQMSVFNVNSDADHGYQAVNTTSGSRLNTALKDTAASIQPFTEDFLNDVGATSVEEILSYAGNVETETEDATNGFNDNPARGAANLDNRFRIRGISGNVTLDYTETGIPMDLYNVDRVEIASGANSILFGMGSQGGILTMSSKRANVQRNTMNVTNVIGTFIDPGHPWNYERLTFDYNVVLIPKKWAFRLNGIFQDGGDRTWQKYANNHVKRINPLITFKPFKDTTISLGYERGRQQNSTYRGWNASDGLTAWFDAGRPIMQGFGASYAAGDALYLPNGTPYYGTVEDAPSGSYRVPITTQISGNTYVLVDNNAQLYNFRQAYVSNNRYPNGTNADGSSGGLSVSSRGEIRLPSDISSYYYNTVGPGGVRIQYFERWSATIEQRIGNLNLELAYNHNKVVATAHAPNGIDPNLNGDPNSLISSYEWNGGAPAVIPDPYSGQLYMESNWVQSFYNQRNDALRLTSEYSLNLKNWGRHHIVFFLEHTENDVYQNTKKEILVDDRQRAINNSDDPTGSANDLIRRQYVTEGDFSTYYSGDWSIPLAPFVMNGETYHSAYVTNNNEALVHVKRKMNSAMLALQSFFFNDALTTTLGVRLDNARYRREQITQIANPNDPRILNKNNVLNEYTLAGTYDPTRVYYPYTCSLGGVWHATDRISVFANYSTNRAPPYVNHNVLPDGGLPPPAKGRTLDYGVMFSLTDKIFLRLTKFDTRQMGDATITPNGVGSPNSAIIGSTNLYNIYDALYFLHPTGQTGLPPGFNASDPAHSDPNSGWAAGTGPGMGPMTPQEYAVTNPPGRPFGAPPQYNSAMVDVISQGYEAQLTANLSQSFTMLFNFSYTSRYRASVFPEIFDYYNKMIPIWMSWFDPNSPNYRPNPNSPDGMYWLNGNVGVTSLRDYVRAQLYGSGGVRQGLNNQLVQQTGPLGSRPFKFNVTARYSFREGMFKGFALGGSVRYSSYNLMPDPNREKLVLPPDDGTDTLQLDPSVYTDTKTMVKGQSLYNVNAFITYRYKMFGGRVNARFQLNVDNIFNNSIITIGRVNDEGGIRRVYVNNPRSIRVTTAFDF